MKKFKKELKKYKDFRVPRETYTNKVFQKDLLTSAGEWMYDNLKNPIITIGKCHQDSPDSEWHPEVVRFLSFGGRQASNPLSFLLLFNATNKEGERFDAVMINLRLGMIIEDFDHVKIGDYDVKFTTWNSRRRGKRTGKFSHVLKSIFTNVPCFIRELTKCGFTADKNFLTRVEDSLNTTVNSMEVETEKRGDNDNYIFYLKHGADKILFSRIALITIKELVPKKFKHQLTINLAKSGFLPAFDLEKDVVREFTGRDIIVLPNPKETEVETYLGREVSPIINEIEKIYNQVAKV